MRAAPADDPAIEGLRGLAALLVLATHYSRFLTPEPGLWGYASTGVDLFFVLSGYVFAPYLLGRPLPLGAHLVRRAFRLYPLYLVALLTYAWLLPEPARWQHFGVHLLMAHTLQSTAIAFHYNPAFWSLPPEVEFYLALPLLAWLARRRLGPALLPAALLLHLLLVLGAAPGDPPDSPRAIASVHLPGLLVEFLLGVAAAALVGRWPGRPRAGLLLAAVAVLGLGLWVFQRHVLGAAPGTVSPWAGGNIGLLAATGYALLVAALAGPGQPAGGSLRAAPACGARWQPWARLGGRLSYGVYLFHNAAPALLERALPGLQGGPGLLASVGLTLLLAGVAHLAIEAPARRLGRRLAQRLEGG